MNYQDLQTLLAQYAHRADLAARIPEFIDRAKERINQRFGANLESFINTTDTNEVLTNIPDLYLFGALEQLYAFENDGDNAVYYDERWERSADRQNVLNPGNTDIDAFNATSGKPLQITPEYYETS